jgi:hypothetical protein
MKLLTLFFFLLLFVTVPSSGQPYSSKFQSTNTDQDSAVSKSHIDRNQIRKREFSSRNHDKFSRQSKRITSKPIRRRSINYRRKIRHPHDYFIASSDRDYSHFFNNMPIIKPNSNGKLIVKKPEPFVKYYLIIKDSYCDKIIK